MRRMLARFENPYVVDLLCDPDAKPFYAPLGMGPATGPTLRRHGNKAGRGESGAIY